MIIPVSFNLLYPLTFVPVNFYLLYLQTFVPGAQVWSAHQRSTAQRRGWRGESGPRRCNWGGWLTGPGYGSCSGSSPPTEHNTYTVGSLIFNITQFLMILWIMIADILWNMIWLIVLASRLYHWASTVMDPCLYLVTDLSDGPSNQTLYHRASVVMEEVDLVYN